MWQVNEIHLIAETDYITILFKLLFQKKFE